ncbi:hypothetical protein, partial [Mesorhizobium sp. M7A.F.Ca.CA.004.01.1.1]
IYGELRFLMPRRPDWGRIEDCTARLVLDHWSAIEALAAHLLVKHDLQFDEALTIVAPHLPPCQQLRRQSVIRSLLDQPFDVI